MVRLGAVRREATPAPAPGGHAVTAAVPGDRAARRGVMPQVEARTRADRPVAVRAREVQSGVEMTGEQLAPSGDRLVRSGGVAVLRGDRLVRSGDQVVPNDGPMACDRADLETVIAESGRQARVRPDRRVRELRRRPDPRPLELGGRRSKL